MKGKHRVQFFTKAGCPLCDEAREMLHRYNDEFSSLVIQEIDIMTDSILYERYKNIIPVVIVDDRFILGARIEEEELSSYLKEAGDARRG